MQWNTGMKVQKTLLINLSEVTQFTFSFSYPISPVKIYGEILVFELGNTGEKCMFVFKYVYV